MKAGQTFGFNKHKVCYFNIKVHTQHDISFGVTYTMKFYFSASTDINWEWYLITISFATVPIILFYNLYFFRI